MPKVLLFALFLVFPLSLSAQSVPEFPTDDEVTTLMLQANLAIKQYQVAMLDETTKLGIDADTEENEKNDQESWKFLMPTIKSRPDNFNSGVGFMVVDALNKSYQNALACEVISLAKVSAAVLLKDDKLQDSAQAVANSCMNAAQLLGVVKMSATNLFVKYLQAEKVLTEKSFNTAASCAEVLKRITANKQQ